MLEISSINCRASGGRCFAGLTSVHAIQHTPQYVVPLQWRHNERDGVSNHQRHDCLLNGLLRRRSRETSKLRVTGLCAGKSPVTGEFPAQMASNATNVSSWWRHHGQSVIYAASAYQCKAICVTVLKNECLYMKAIYINDGAHDKLHTRVISVVCDDTTADLW